jgi:hypothetical protein
MNPQLHRMVLQIGTFACFIYLLCGVSRLARFNISNDPKPRNPGRAGQKYFVGMPIPAAAGMIAATVHFCYGFPIPNWAFAVLWIGLVGLLGFLMVSTWRFWSGKEIDLSGRQPFQLIAVVAIFIFVLVYFSNYVLFFIALTYLFSGLWSRAAYGWQRRRRQGVDGEVEPIPTRSAAAFRTEYEQRTATQMDFTPTEPLQPGPLQPGPLQPGPYQPVQRTAVTRAETVPMPPAGFVSRPPPVPPVPVVTTTPLVETRPIAPVREDRGPTAAEMEWARVREEERRAEAEAARKAANESNQDRGGAR